MVIFLFLVDCIDHIIYLSSIFCQWYTDKLISFFDVIKQLSSLKEIVISIQLCICQWILINFRESLEQFVLENDENDPKNDEVYKCMYRMILDHFNEMEHEEADQKQRLSQRVVYDNIKVIQRSRPSSW